jgi:hypothetical protein
MLVYQSLKPYSKFYQLIQGGAPKIAKLPYFSGFMVDITIVNRAFVMVYKPTYNWGAPSCTTSQDLGGGFSLGERLVGSDLHRSRLAQAASDANLIAAAVQHL